MIEVRNITKSFDGRTVLHGVSATFETGKTNLIIGQSGSGKTVLMKSLVGLLQPEKGEILFDGRNLLSMSRAEIHELRKEIGMLFQGSALFDSETVLGNVMFPLSMFRQQEKCLFALMQYRSSSAHRHRSPYRNQCTPYPAANRLSFLYPPPYGGYILPA